jgi:hypothetical protein
LPDAAAGFKLEGAHHCKISAACVEPVPRRSSLTLVHRMSRAIGHRAVIGTSWDADYKQLPDVHTP